ncbi:MAG: hypothetical protein KC503_01130, partial [Myxococcales bacterium]|nr:hypothetical protein [Myxococcales bacterium]
GHLDRAAAVLREIDIKTKGLDRARYHTLSGLVALKRRDYRVAAAELAAAIGAGQRDKNAYLLLAQARFGMKDYRGTLAALEQVGALARRYVGVYLMRAQAHWRLGERGGAWRALGEGLSRFPSDRQLVRQKVLLMVELGLYSGATQIGLRYLARGGDETDYVAIAEALRRGKQHRRAILILEQAKLALPRSDRILKQLARAYLDDNKPLAAAELLARAAYAKPKYRVEAAELYRRAGRLITALYFNGLVLEQKPKVRQRLGLLIELARFEQAAAMAPRLSRLGLLADQRIVYALAYALYKVGRYKRAERWLKRLTKPELFQRAIELRKAMAVCSASGFACP